MPQLFEEIAYLLAESEGLEPAPLAGTTDPAHLARLQSEIRLGVDSKIGVSALIALADSEKKLKGGRARLTDVDMALLAYRTKSPEGLIGLHAGVAFRGHKRAAEIRDLEKVVKPLDYDSLQYIERKRVDELAVSPVDLRTGVVKYDNENSQHAPNPRGEVWAALLQRIGASKAEAILQGVTAYNVAQRRIARLKDEQSRDVVETPAMV